MGFITFFALGLVLSFGTVLSERKDIHHMMYETFTDTAMCFRVLNGTHQFGCSTSQSGSTGVVHIVNNDADLKWLLEDAKAGPYMAVIPPTLFTKDSMNKLVASRHVSGVLLALNESQQRPRDMSPDDTCPNRYSSLSGSCDDAHPWNPLGTGFLLTDWPIPLFVVRDSQALIKIHDCYMKFNLPLESQAERPLCSLQMTGHMYAAVDTPTCLRRNNLVNSASRIFYCDPMGDQNVVLQLFPREHYKAAPNGSVVLVTAKLDAAGMFDQVAPGAMATVSGVVTLLTTAHLLSMLLPEHKNTYTKNVVFALLNGEAQDYIGSSRVVYDMQQGTFLSSSFPLRLEHLDQVIDLNQINGTALHCHCVKSSAAQNTIDMLKESGTKFNVSVDGSCLDKLPPSSLHEFLKASSSLPGLILTNHANQYSNMYYNGLLDDSMNLGFKFANGSKIPDSSVQQNLASVSQTLALTLAKLVDPDIPWPADLDAGNISALVDQLLYCYLESKQCELFRNVTDVMLMRDGPFPLYVGVSRSPNMITRLSRRVLAHLTGSPTNKTEDQCKNKQDSSDNVDYTFEWIDGVCLETGLVMTPAVSPAFVIDDYDWKSGNYSSWTESVWSELGLRMFLRPSYMQELNTLIAGLAVLFFSFLSVYWVNHHADQLFSPAPCERC